MPRSARIDIPHLLQHVIVRGVNRCAIFLDDQDRLRFLLRLSQLLEETQTACLAWSLMPNHCHLLVRPGAKGLAYVMRRLLTGHAIYFNRRHARSGHLFENRYKSLVCETEPYLLELVRYIHLNPLRAGLVKELSALDHYPWSGHSVLMGHAQLAGQLCEEVLQLFSVHQREARRRYQLFMADGIERGRQGALVGHRSRQADPLTSDIRDDRILGTTEFARQVQTLGALPRRQTAPRPELDEIVRRVCQHYGLEIRDLHQKTRTSLIAAARSVICYLAVRESGYCGVQVGEHVGLGRAGVSRAAERGHLLAKSDPRLSDLINK